MSKNPFIEPNGQPIVYVREVASEDMPDELRDASPQRLGQFQMNLRRALIESGEFYIVSTNLDGVGALRVTIINPLTNESHLDQLLESLREKGRKILET